MVHDGPRRSRETEQRPKRLREESANRDNAPHPHPRAFRRVPTMLRPVPRSFFSVCTLSLITLSTAASSIALAKDEKASEIPVCDKKIGTLSVVEPENKWWVQYGLESPEALIKVFVAQSKCFTLLDRGKGLAP